MAADQELLAVVERRFAELAASIDDSRRETRERFDQVDQRFERVDQRFEQVDQRFDRLETGTTERFDRLETATGERFDLLETEIRQAHVRIESLEGVVQQVAEGVSGVDERLERFRVEVRREFKEVRGQIRLSYGQLDQRITALDGR